MHPGRFHSVPSGCRTPIREKVCPSAVLDLALQNMDKYETDPDLVHLIEEGYFQVGTLGGGNHFIKLQEDEEGYLGIMIHSGNRHLGKEICDYFHNKARELNSTWHSRWIS